MPGLAARCARPLCSSRSPRPAAPEVGTLDAKDIFAEMRPFMVVDGQDIDDSREAIYTRMEGE